MDSIEAEARRTRDILLRIPKMAERLRGRNGLPAPPDLYRDDPAAVAECCMDRADEPEVAVLEARIRVLEAERDRYIDWNSGLGAKNERLTDQNADLARRCERQSGSITTLQAELTWAKPRLSAGWEHLPDPCVAPPAPVAPPGSLAWALGQSHSGRYIARL